MIKPQQMVSRRTQSDEYNVVWQKKGYDFLFLFLALLHEAEEKGFGPGEHELVTFGIEVGMVIRGLEVLAAEVGILYMNGTATCVEYWDMVASTDFVDGFDDGFETRSLDMPWRDKSNGCMRIFLAQALA